MLLNIGWLKRLNPGIINIQKTTCYDRKQAENNKKYLLHRARLWSNKQKVGNELYEATDWGLYCKNP